MTILEVAAMVFIVGCFFFGNSHMVAAVLLLLFCCGFLSVGLDFYERKTGQKVILSAKPKKDAPF